MTSTEKPSLDVIIERLKQNTALTREIKDQVTEGLKAVDIRLTDAEKRLDHSEWQRQNDAKELEAAKEDAKQVIASAANKAQDDLKPPIGSTKWVLVTLVAIILALIAALK